MMVRGMMGGGEVRDDGERGGEVRDDGERGGEVRDDGERGRGRWWEEGKGGKGRREDDEER